VRVILLNDQRHLGKRGEIVDVKPGYGRNFLLPQGLALEATEGNIKIFQQQRAKIDARVAKEREAAQEIANKLAGLQIVIPKRVGETETLYGSVTTSDIAEALEAKGFTVDRRRIDIGGAGIKTLGDHVAHVELHSDVVADVTVSVVREE
jgi:large subunit ribosomal protein L9